MTLWVDGAVFEVGWTIGPTKDALDWAEERVVASYLDVEKARCEDRTLKCSWKCSVCVGRQVEHWAGEAESSFEFKCYGARLGWLITWADRNNAVVNEAVINTAIAEGNLIGGCIERHHWGVVNVTTSVIDPDER